MPRGLPRALFVPKGGPRGLKPAPDLKREGEGAPFGGWGIGRGSRGLRKKGGEGAGGVSGALGPPVSKTPPFFSRGVAGVFPGGAMVRPSGGPRGLRGGGTTPRQTGGKRGPRGLGPLGANPPRASPPLWAKPQGGGLWNEGVFPPAPPPFLP